MATSDLHAPPALAPSARSGGDSATSPGKSPFAPFGEDGFTFGDLLDIVNPLQHIPIVSTFYRQITGDTIDPASRLAGGALFGGMIGAVIAMANVAVEDATGKDVGEQVVALLSGGAAEPPASVVADATATIDSATGTTTPIPDLALLGPLPAPPTASPPEPIVAAAMPPAIAITAPPLLDLATLAPLAPLARAANPPAVATVATAGAAPANPGATREPNRPKADRPTLPDMTGTSPPGALASEGGWFTQTMLSALAKYDMAARLGAADPETAALTVSN